MIRKCGKCVMKKGALILGVGIILLVGFYIGTIRHDNIKVKDVKSIKVDDKEYSAESDIKQIKEIVSMYNEARKYTNSVGTTPTHSIVIELKNNENIQVLGNTQKFQTVIRNKKQYNITSSKLRKYFKSLDIKE